MDYFKETIKNAKREYDDGCRKTLVFSKKMQNAMGLTDQDIEDAKSNDIVFEVGAVLITSDSRHLCGDWHNVLLAIPRKATGTYGYTGSDSSLPDGWVGTKRGTCSSICPDVETQKLILDRIKVLKKGGVYAS